MKTPPLDKVVGVLVGLGIPGLVLLVAVATAGVAGGAAVVVALAALGGPLGMVGGIAVLAVLVMVSKGLAEYGFERILHGVIRGLKAKGTSKSEVLEKVADYPISSSLKAKLKDLVNEHWDEL